VKFIRIIIICFTCIISYPALSDNSLNLPDIGDSTGSFLSPEMERRLGQAFLGQVRKEANIISDPEVETYIQSIGYRLVSQSDNNTQGFTFFVINDTLINAFAAPGGIVGINSGVILNSDTESELAGVMAHEIAHVTQRHMARSMEMQAQMSLPMMAAMLGAILIATQNPEAGQAAIMAIQGGAVQAQINFTRDNEAEADRVGMQLLARSQFSPQGMPVFFEKLQQNSRYGSQAPEFLRTHPLTSNRISDTRSRADAYPSDLNYQESSSYPFIKAKVMVLSFKNPDEAVNYFNNRVENEKFTNEYASLRYGYALALIAAGDYPLATEHLQALLKDNPEKQNAIIMSRHTFITIRR
jgi:predicted Zn-dependent protease